MVKSWERMCGYKTIQFFIIHQSKTFTDEEKQIVEFNNNLLCFNARERMGRFCMGATCEIR